MKSPIAVFFGFLPLLLLTGLQSCAPTVSGMQPRGVAVPARSVRVDVSPAQVTGGKLAAGADEVERRVFDSKGSVDSAVKLAEQARRLVDLKNTALVSALDETLAELEKARSGYRGLVLLVSQHKEMISGLNNELEIISGRAADGQREISQLRAALEEANSKIKDSGNQVLRLQGDNQKLIKSTASALVYKHFILWVIWIVLGVFFLGLIIYFLNRRFPLI